MVDIVLTCPHCGKVNDSHMNPRDPTEVPGENDWCICIGCGKVSVVEGDHLRKMNLVEKIHAAADEELQNGLRAWREVMGKK
jgi:hypothetical protein